MPLSIDPNATFRIVLDSDQGKDPEPAFIYRYLTGKEWRKLARLTEEMAQPSGITESLDKIYEAVLIGFHGWENITKFGKEFKDCTLEDLLSPAEAQEIIAKIMTQSFSPADKKKCGSPSAAGSGPSVNSPAAVQNPPPVTNAVPSLKPEIPLNSSAPSVAEPVVPFAVRERLRSTAAPSS